MFAIAFSSSLTRGAILTLKARRSGAGLSMVEQRAHDEIGHDDHKDHRYDSLIAPHTHKPTLVRKRSRAHSRRAAKPWSAGLTSGSPQSSVRTIAP